MGFWWKNVWIGRKVVFSLCKVGVINVVVTILIALLLMIKIVKIVFLYIIQLMLVKISN